ncbi:MAG TPA: hypothetical protein VFO10_16340 [Oligoflexus sp.]|uniref:hypothetical protein n=1 Tax=Oligoflexus sp. TaxID=1971216 RepID=UPI002D802B7A|nr:hypothetical protein [Oligoflexus sp.]HET9238827.1 hypothetical protein [Oligoflexus sp.]
MHQSEWPALQRLDLAYTIPFLSASAAAMCELGLASDRDADNLRQTIKDHQRQRGEGHKVLLQELMDQNNAIVALLQARYGWDGFDALLFRWTISRAAEDLAHELWNFSEELVKKAELMFNQPMLIMEGDAVERRSLFSIFLVDVAAHIGGIAEQLQNHGLSLRIHYPLPALDVKLDGLDKGLATHLGFTLGEVEALPYQKLQGTLRLLYVEMENLFALLSATLTQIRANCTGSDHDQAVQMIIEDMEGEMGRLQKTQVYAPAALPQMENRRQRLLGTLLAVRSGIHEIRQHFQDILRTSRVKAPLEWVWPVAERRQLLSALLSRSVSIRDAELAMDALERYCRQHLVAPDQLLGAELNRIHKELDEASLQILRKIAMDKGIGQSLIQEKQVVLHRKDKLLHVIQTNLSRALVLTFLCLYLPGCGVKTAPRSDVLDLRPAVPYHAEQRTNQKSTEKPVQPATPSRPQEK